MRAKNKSTAVVSSRAIGVIGKALQVFTGTDPAEMIVRKVNVFATEELLEFIRRRFKIKFELEVLEIDEVPMFNQDEKWDESFQLRLLNNKITRADGVIIATPEHNHTISAALKSVLEWLSFEVHPFENKPVMIVGASYYDQGTSRA